METTLLAADTEALTGKNESDIILISNNRREL